MTINRRDFDVFDGQAVRQLMKALAPGGKIDSEAQTLSNKTLTSPVINGGTGSFSGSFLGVLNATTLKQTAVEYVADGAIAPTDSYVKLNAANATCDMTIAAPIAGHWLIITATDVSNSVTVTCTAGDFDGTGASGDVATFNAVEDTLVLFGISATRWIIVANESVTLG
jgi:hypothetical protein